MSGSQTDASAHTARPTTTAPAQMVFQPPTQRPNLKVNMVQLIPISPWTSLTPPLGLPAYIYPSHCHINSWQDSEKDSTGGQERCGRRISALN